MDDIKRITPEEVVAAYKKTGLKIAQCEYVTKDGKCGCGMGAYAIAFLDVISNDADDFQEELMLHGFTSSYHDGFADGFDGIEVDSIDSNVGRHRPSDRHLYDVGYADGQAAYAAASKEAANG